MRSRQRMGPVSHRTRDALLDSARGTIFRLSGPSIHGGQNHSGPKRLGGNLRENGDESGHSSYPEEVYSHKQ